MTLFADIYFMCIFVHCLTVELKVLKTLEVANMDGPDMSQMESNMIKNNDGTEKHYITHHFGDILEEIAIRSTILFLD